MRTSATKAFWGRKAMAVALSATMCVACVPAATFAAASAEAADDGYTYLFASIPYDEYWESENDIYLNGTDWTASSTLLDTNSEYDKGAYDAVSRATINHGVARASFTSIETIYDTEGNAYKVQSYSDDGKSLIMTDGSTYTYAKNDTKAYTLTGSDGVSHTQAKHVNSGFKYVPVKVATSDLAAFKAKYQTYENGSSVNGGSPNEGNMKPFNYIAAVTANTNGLKTATKQSDGTFDFSASTTGTDTGLLTSDGETLAQKSASSLTPVYYNTESKYGDIMRLDVTTDGYGDLGANMYAVTWSYYGSGSTTGTPLATYGTKFAADNWMHSKQGIQLGLTKSDRFQLPAGTDGSGNWTVTIRALGYSDTTYTFVATTNSSEATIDKAATDKLLVREETFTQATDADKANLEAALTEAKAIKDSGYTSESWEYLQDEIKEGEELLAAFGDETGRAAVNEQIEHITTAINALEKEKATQTITGGVVKATIKAAGKKTNKMHSFKIGCTAKTSLTYKLTSISKKAKGKVTVAKNGKVTVKKGLKKGKYTAKVKITAAATDTYKAATKMFSVKIIVK